MRLERSAVACSDASMMVFWRGGPVRVLQRYLAVSISPLGIIFYFCLYKTQEDMKSIIFM